MRLTTGARIRPWWNHLASPWSAVAIAAGLVLVFGLDRATDAAPVQHLYYLPIILAGLAFDMTGGLLVALAAVVLYHAANPHLLTFRYEESDVVQIVLFAVVGVVTAQLARDATRLHQLSRTDDLTGLHNLRSFEEHLHELVRSARAGGTSLALLVLDLDRLKGLNDRYGHQTGAEAVRRVGQILAERLPETAVACRYGGDEFVVALPGCGTAAAAAVAEGLRAAVRGAPLLLAGHSFPPQTLSISIGACDAAHLGLADGRAPSDAALGEALFQAADAALYRAKAAGRNRVVAGQPRGSGRSGGSGQTAAAAG